MKRYFLLQCIVMLALAMQAQTTQTHWIENGTRRIFGELFTPQQPREEPSIAIIAHGFNGTHEYGRNYYETLGRLGYSCYTLDFPCGSVRSRSDSNTMNMSILDEVSDLKTVVQHFRNQGFRHVVLIGESQGGLVSALTAADLKQDISRLVLVYPALCIPDNWRQRYPRLEDIQDVTELWGVKMGRRFFEEIHDMKPLDIIGQYRGPVLIVQGDKDLVVSMDDSRRAQQLYAPGTRLHVIPGAAHGFRPDELKQEMEQLEAFFKKKYLIYDQMLEVIGAANALGIKAQTKEFADKMMQMTDEMMPYSPSMKLDFDFHRPMEVYYLYTRPIEEVRKAGFDMPKQAMLEAELKFIDELSC